MVGWIAQQYGVTLHDPDRVAHFLAQRCIALTFHTGVPEVWVDGQQVTVALQGEAVARMASAVAVLPVVRQFITAQLRHVRCGGPLVMEGRDIGTVVFPDASIKFFLDATVEQRGRRRFQEMQRAGFVGTLADVMQAVTTRDEQDRRRTAAPLQCAPDAYRIDTTDLAIDDVVQTMLSHIQNNIPTG